MIPRRSRKNEKQSNNSNNDEEVDRMLQAAQDELLLKLSVDSHTTNLSADQLLPDDLDCRFQALKSQRPKSHPPPRQSASPSVHKPQDDGDLFARFAALKGSGSGVSSSSSGDGVGAGVDEDNEEDEVEKIIRWAKDAARLDPSPPSDDEDGDDKEDDSSNDEEDDSSDDGKVGAQTTGWRR